MKIFSYAIALTGGIATGKSSCTTFLKELGYPIIDLDKIAHGLLNKNPSAIADIFGKEFIQNGKVLRKKLGFVVFSNQDKKDELENFLHPLIRQETLKQAEEKELLKKPYFVDIPLYFEKKEFYPFKYSVVVYTSKTLQLQRLMKRSSLSLEEAKCRINSQLDIEEKKKIADFVIDNSGNLEELKQEVDRLRLWVKEQYASFKI